MHDFLKKILQNKEKEVEALKRQEYLFEVGARVSNKSFKGALSKGNAVIAEIKRQSPSKSHIGEIPNPVELACQYEMGGAAAISVLTDSFGFGGSIKDLESVADALKTSPVAVLQKDFILDPIQIKEAVFAGADAILLIVSALKEKTADLLAAAKAMNMDALVEVMNQDELEYAVSISSDLIAVNNRDLTTFQVDMTRALTLSSFIPDTVISVAASGMDSPAVVSEYFAAGYRAVLVGEALVRSSDPEKFIRECAN